MTTLNARASEAWHAQIAETGEGFDHQQGAFEEGWETGYKAAAAESQSAPRPVIDREAVLKAIGDTINQRIEFIEERPDVAAAYEAATDAVMELARPMPTREQIREHLELHWAFATDVESNEMTSAVLALLGGSES